MTRKLDTDVRREQIARAALAVVSEYGVRGLSIGRVARRVRLVPSALYRHFRGKEAIVDSVLELVRDRLLENVRSVTEEASDPIEQLRLLLERHVQFIRENLGLQRVVFSEHVYDGRPARRRAMFATIRTYLSRVAEIVRRGQASGRIRRDVDADTVSVMFLGLVQPAAILWQMSDGEFDVTAQSGRAWEIFVEAIGAR